MTRSTGKSWRGPTIREIAALSGLGSATVDRVLNNRPGVKPVTRQRVQAALRKLSLAQGQESDLRIRLLCESGVTFNGAIAAAADSIKRTLPGVEIEDDYWATDKFKAAEFARHISRTSDIFDGLILIAREHPAVNQAVRGLQKEGLPVVCLTTDLPSSRRNCYVGNDQYAAGSVAGQLIGHALPKAEQRILLVMSVAFRCQQEREMGFRRVLRSHYPHLRIEERVTSDDLPESAYHLLSDYFRSNGTPTAIYNVAGANRGVAKALDKLGIAQSTIFVGHELTPVSQSLLENGVMDYVISHDFTEEVRTACEWIRSFHRGLHDEPRPTQILVHTKFNCQI